MIGTVLLVSVITTAPADRTEHKVYSATRTSTPPVIDGKLDDSAWSTDRFVSGFVQREPHDGDEPSQQTAFQIAYDDRNIYVAIRAFDTEPSSIERRVTRRDTKDGDQVAVFLDSYFDRQSAFAFNVSSAGVKTDSFLSSGGDDEDGSWDAIWYAEVDVDGEGWSAELQVPLSQIRFGSRDSQTWGLQVSRYLHRKQELSFWQAIPKEASGVVPRYGELRGIDGIAPRRQIEIAPYVVGKTERFAAEAGNPFATGTSYDATGGVDGRVGVTTDLTLSFTANPDFGQVEADPSEVNLSTYETFFSEKRPFFIEGRNILNFQASGGDGGFSSDNLFYSRRIGRRPRYEPELDDDEYMSYPDATPILGAVKLTGKTRRGVSIGVLESVTSEERAEIELRGVRREPTVEPLTNFFVSRVQKDFARGNTIVGGMFTSTNRDNETPALAAFLHSGAYTGGIDFEHRWKDRSYWFSAKTLFSQVRGEEEAILESQRSAVRYYQRPDATHVEVDPTRTSLSGHGGTVEVGKGGGGHLRFSSGLTWRSPGLELNDVGYLRSADRLMQWAWAGYQVWKPFSIFRRLNVNGNQWRGWDFSKTNLFDGGNVNGNMQLTNYWRVGAGLNREGETLDTSALRGGPALRWPGGWGNWLWFSTDDRKKWRVDFNSWNFWGDEGSQRSVGYNVGINYRPSRALLLSFNPSLNREKNELQYVDTPEAADGPRYIFAGIDRWTAAMTIRINYSITPNLSVQYYGQPFVSAAEYRGFKKITRPRADSFSDRAASIDEALTYDESARQYLADENGDGVTDYRFDDPDFNFRQFRSNLVVRWEYSPGSALYVVWSQDRTADAETGSFEYGRDLSGLFSTHPRNVFLVKFSRSFLF